MGQRWLYLANVRVPSEKAHVYQIFQMLQAFQEAGVEVELVYPQRANLPGTGNQDPLQLYGMHTHLRLRPLYSLDAVRLVTIDAPALNRPPFPATAFAVQSATFALLAALYTWRRHPDVVYSRDWPVLTAVSGLRPKATMVWEAHDLPQGRPAGVAFRRLLPQLAGVVAISRGLGTELQQMGLRSERLLIAPDAVDPTRFASPPAKAAARATLDLPIDAQIVAYTGHLYAWKGAHTLALASRDLPERTLVCLVGGTRADLEACRAFLDRHRLERVRLAGHVPPAQVPAWLAAADVLALPNSGQDALSARYTSPLKLFEYMAAGRPIVASDLPSLREVLTHGENAYLVPPDDPAALATGLRKLLADPPLAGRLAANARCAVARRTWQARARQITGFVARLRVAP